MKLYGSTTSPFVRHCRIALLQTPFDWQLVNADYAASAQASPAQKVPYFEDGTVFLSDSASILKYVREKSAQAFLPDVATYELFCLTNTLLDASINLLLLSRDNITPQPGDYLSRQTNRIQTGLTALDTTLQTHTQAELDDAEWRIACYIDWALFRQRIDLSPYTNLAALLQRAKQHLEFTDTDPR